MPRPGVVVGAVILALALGVPAAAADLPPPDICLSIGLPGPDAGTVATVTESVEAALATRPVLLPSPVVAASVGDGVDVAVWAETPVDEGSAGVLTTGGCSDHATPGTWSASIAGSFLRAGTKRELAAMRTTPGFSSSIDVEWDETADRVRTVLTFAGPFDIPNGTCWLDDVVAADGSGGTSTSTTTGSRTSPFGEGVCGRFEEYLADGGGAGAQALILLPRTFDLPAGTVLRLSVDGVDVRADRIGLWGTASADAPWPGLSGARTLAFG